MVNDSAGRRVIMYRQFLPPTHKLAAESKFWTAQSKIYINAQTKENIKQNIHQNTGRKVILRSQFVYILHCQL